MTGKFGSAIVHIVNNNKIWTIDTEGDFVS